MTSIRAVADRTAEPTTRPFTELSKEIFDAVCLRATISKDDLGSTLVPLSAAAIEWAFSDTIFLSRRHRQTITYICSRFVLWAGTPFAMSLDDRMK